MVLFSRVVGVTLTYCCRWSEMLLDMLRCSIICVDVRGSRKAISDIDSCMDDWLHGSGHFSTAFGF